MENIDRCLSEENYGYNGSRAGDIPQLLVEGWFFKAQHVHGGGYFGNLYGIVEACFIFNKENLW